MYNNYRNIPHQFKWRACNHELVIIHSITSYYIIPSKPFQTLIKTSLRCLIEVQRVQGKFQVLTEIRMKSKLNSAWYSITRAVFEKQRLLRTTASFPLNVCRNLTNGGRGDNKNYQANYRVDVILPPLEQSSLQLFVSRW